MEEVTLEFVEEFGSSLGVAGWADPNLRLLDYAAMERERLAGKGDKDEMRGCCSIGSNNDECEADEHDATDAHNRQVTSSSTSWDRQVLVSGPS